MEIIVNDASALIDLYKAGLLENYSRLGCRLILPDAVEDELSSLHLVDFRALGFSVAELDGLGVVKLKALRDSHQHLSVADTFALVVAETMSGSILLTGDAGLRRVAEGRGVEVHGVLWLLDLLYAESLVTSAKVLQTLAIFETDRTVRLPRRLLLEYVARYRAAE